MEIKYAWAKVILKPDDQGRIDLTELLSYLKAWNCPDEILNPLIEWAETPVITKDHLEAWKAKSAKAV